MRPSGAEVRHVHHCKCSNLGRRGEGERGEERRGEGRGGGEERGGELKGKWEEEIVIVLAFLCPLV